MSVGVRVPLAEARATAQAIVAVLAPACERIEIAGSIRRERPDVGDVEIVAVPKVHMTTQADGLFETATVELDETTAVLEHLVGLGELVPLNDGDRYSKYEVRPDGLQLDLFRVRPPAQWGVIFLIRTGPAAFSQWVVTEARRRGFHVTSGALHRGNLQCGALPCEVVDTPEEGDFLGALGMAWRPPHLRDGAFFR